MSLARPFPLALAALALVLASCDARKVESASAASNRCARCHGGQDDQSGAPPLDTHGRSDPALPSVGAHSAHIRAGLDCSGCHVKPAPGDTSHIDGNVRVSFGPLATRNGALSPSYDQATYGCSTVYCHGSFTGGNASNAPRWTATGQHQADCGSCHGDVAGTAAPTSGHPALAAGSTNATCAACHPETVDSSGLIRATGKHVNGVFETDAAAKHPAGWTDPASDAFHGITAALAPLTCNRCHAVRRPAAVTDVTCADCHLGGQAWTTTCNGCHGEPGDPRGAPPADVRGRTATTAIGVGAHRLHVDSQVVSGPLDCVFCHRKPADAYDPGAPRRHAHRDGLPGRRRRVDRGRARPGLEPRHRELLDLLLPQRLRADERAGVDRAAREHVRHLPRAAAVRAAPRRREQPHRLQRLPPGHHHGRGPAHPAARGQAPRRPRERERRSPERVDRSGEPGVPRVLRGSRPLRLPALPRRRPRRRLHRRRVRVVPRPEPSGRRRQLEGELPHVPRRHERRDRRAAPDDLGLPGRPRPRRRAHRARERRPARGAHRVRDLPRHARGRARGGARRPRHRPHPADGLRDVLRARDRERRDAELEPRRTAGAPSTATARRSSGPRRRGATPRRTGPAARARRPAAPATASLPAARTRSGPTAARATRATGRRR